MTADESVIELSLPPSLRFAPVVRVLAASLAADEDFAISALAEMRNAIQEVFEAIVQHTVPADRSEADAAIVVRFTVAPGCVGVEFVNAPDLQPAVGDRQSTVGVEPSGERLVVDNGRITLTKQLHYEHATLPTDES